MFSNGFVLKSSQERRGDMRYGDSKIGDGALDDTKKGESGSIRKVAFSLEGNASVA